MNPSDSRSGQPREIGNTSGSKWSLGQSYLRQYSGVLGKSLDEDTTKHLNVVDEYEKLRSELENNLNEAKSKKLYEMSKNICKDEEIIIEQDKVLKITKKIGELKTILTNRDIKTLNNEINSKIKESNHLNNEFNNIRKSKKYDILQENRLIRSKKLSVERNLENIVYDRWSNIEIQLEKYIACIISKEQHKKLSSKWREIPYLRDFPLEQAWRLCIDGQYQKDDGPKFTVDNEPSFLAGTKRLLNAMLGGLCIDELNFDGHSPKKLTADYYKQLHYIVVGGTYREVREGARKQQFELGYAHLKATGFSRTVECSSVTAEGRRELQEKIDCKEGSQKTDARYGEAGHPVGNCCDWIIWTSKVSPQTDGTDPLVNLGRKQFDGSSSATFPQIIEKISYQYNTKRMTREERQEIANALINKYYEEIKSAKEQNDEDKKLTAIVHCCQDLAQARLFLDGNIRTIAFGVLPKLLLENGFRPCILPDPNILNGFSVEEIKDAIREGQGTFQSWCEQAREKSPKGYKDRLKKKFVAALHTASDIKSVESLRQWSTWSGPELSRFKAMAITRDWYGRLYQKEASRLASEASPGADPETLCTQTLNDSTGESGEGSS